MIDQYRAGRKAKISHTVVTTYELCMGK